MRVKATLSLVCVLALALYLVAQFRTRFSRHAESRRGNLPQAERNQAEHPHHPLEAATTNPAPEPGFYVGKGDERVYVNYATPDPVLRSFIQSVMDGSSDPKAKGKEIFLKLCAICHQPDGGGKDGLAPPLAGSEWALTPGGGRMVRIVLNGLTGPLQVRGKTWNLTMPPWRENLTDDQVAVVLTYVRSQLGENNAGAVTPEMVAAARKETRANPETANELLRISD